MSEDVAMFAQTIDADAVLADELWSITQPVEFVAVAVRRAAERGIILTEGEVWEAFNAGRLAWLATQTP